jgi:hypothetical protein
MRTNLELFDSGLVRCGSVQFSSVRFGRQDLHDEIRIGKPPLDDVDAKILAIFKQISFQVSAFNS